MAAVTPTSTGEARSQLVNVWQDRIKRARAVRKQYEPGWLLDLAFAAGQQWVAYDRRHHKVRALADLDPRYEDRELYTADRIKEYRDAILAELNADDDRQTLLAAREGAISEAAAGELNKVAGYAWDHDWNADAALRRARRYCVDTGVAAIRCRWNPARGDVTGHAPIDQYGTPVADPAALSHLVEHGQLPDGSLPKFKPVREGATDWLPYSSFHMLTPPGVVHEDDFPWEVLMIPTLVDDLKGEYGPVAANLTEDADIASTMGIPAGRQAQAGEVTTDRLRGFCWQYLCFERPTQAHPMGQVIVFASSQMVLLDAREGLDYTDEQGRPHSGIVYLHYSRRSDRFWSGSFIQGLRDPQRIINRRKTQNVEIIDRHMPKTYVGKGDLPETPAGIPGEIVEMDPNAKGPPVFFPGAGPGAWMYSDIASLDEDLSHASTMSALKLGENPQGVETYSQLVVLTELEQLKRSEIRLEHRAAVGLLEIMSLKDIERYWPQEKMIYVQGDEDQVTQQLFRKEQIPSQYMVRRATGAPLPRSQAAELKKLDAIWAAAVQAWVAVNDGQTWVEWYADSLEAGQPVDLPEAPKDSQQEMARLENLLMRQGQQPQVMDYDVMPIHLPEHRQAEDEARAAGDIAQLARIVRHVQDHIQMAQQNAAQLAQAQQQPSPLGPGAPTAPQPFTPQPREPYPNRIGAEFTSLAGGNQ
jgi:uncharacterized protein (DUF2384 family)